MNRISKRLAPYREQSDTVQRLQDCPALKSPGSCPFERVTVMYEHDVHHVPDTQE